MTVAEARVTPGAVEQTMVAIMPFPMLLIDARGTIGALNRPAGLLFGFDPDEAIAKSVGLLLPQLFRDIRDASIASYAGRNDGSRAAQSRVLIGCHRNGQEMPIEIIAGETLRDGDRLFVCLVRGVDSAHANAGPVAPQPNTLTLTELIATTSNLVHDLNQPLTAMSNFLAAAQIALAAKAAPEAIADFVTDASAQSLRARAIVRRLREILAN